VGEPGASRAGVSMAARQGFDFERWARLARDDPGTFEQERARLIGELIAAAPPELRPRLEALQWRIEQVRRRSRTPLAACLKISAMMWERVTGAHGLLPHLRRLTAPEWPVDKPPRGRMGRLLPFRPPGSRSPPDGQEGP